VGGTIREEAVAPSGLGDPREVGGQGFTPLAIDLRRVAAGHQGWHPWLSAGQQPMAPLAIAATALRLGIGGLNRVGFALVEAEQLALQLGLSTTVAKRGLL
jgi:hypothetical protein